MTPQFYKKEGVALTQLAHYLLGQSSHDRLKTIGELSQEFSLSVGVIQAALKTLEQQGCIQLERRGRNGTVILSIDYTALLSLANIQHFVCAMPLPYTKLYEGLASGLKTQFEQPPIYFAYMHGADVRIKCLLNGAYDMAVVSRLAAEPYLKQGEVKIALSLGESSYVKAHQLICRRGEQAKIKRVGIDFRSPDQRQLTEIYFANQTIEMINIPYQEGIALIEKGSIDAMIWNIVDNPLSSEKLTQIPLTHHPIYQQATEAVILTQCDNPFIHQLLKRVVNIPLLLQHQQAVQAGLIDPVY